MLQPHVPGRRFDGQEKSFLVMSKEAVSQLITLEQHILISVQSHQRKSDDQLVLPDNTARIATLNLEFDDYDYPQQKYLSEEKLTRDGIAPIFFSDEHAREIKKFVEQHEDVALIVCHCDHGHSRSPAIVIALSEWLNKDSAELQKWFGGFNALVRDKLLAVLNESPLESGDMPQP